MATGPLILGLNATYHECAAALTDGPRVVAAVEQERLSRVKHSKRASIEGCLCLPWAAIDACLAAAGTTLAEVDAVAWSFDPALRFAQNAALPEAASLPPGHYGSALGERRLRDLHAFVPALLGARYGTDLAGRFFWLPHHHCHLASAFYPSPFGRAAVLSVDGIGEWTTTASAHGSGARLTVHDELGYPHSLGFLWEKVTAFLGFSRNADECKVMGLASYGRPEIYREAFGRLIEVGTGSFRVDAERLCPRREDDFAGLEALFGPRRLPGAPLAYEGPDRRHADIAAALQSVTEDAMLALAERALAATGERHLCLAGGVALNCVANGRIAREVVPGDLFIQPAANDAGTALGAALLLYYRDFASERRPTRFDPYVGPAYAAAECLAALERHRLTAHIVDLAGRDLAAELAARLAAGRIVAVFQGGLEFGPRALGHRSLLADPRTAAIRDTLNRRVKHREPFRPLCPAVLAERAGEWFDFGGRAPVSAADHMLVTYFARPEQRARIAGVVHVDGTSRVQLVHAAHTPFLHRLIAAFAEATGIPMVLNTSFNVREPIVASPDDAVRCFLATAIDDLLLGDLLVAR